MVYLDYSATTPVDKDILDTYVKTTNNFFANTASLHKLGQESNYMYELAIKEIIDTLNVPNHDIIFTSNATEANNLAIFGLVKRNKSGKIITTKIEHASVFEVMRSLEKQFEVVYLDVDNEGQINLEQLKNEMTKDTILVSTMWVNNIVGVVEKIEEVIKIVKEYPKCKLHVDAVQGLCKVIPNFKLSDIDVFTFSTHKIYGPKGMGGMIFRKGLEFEKHLYGSSVQFGLKPGTFDLSLVVCTAKAFKKFYPLTKTHSDYMKSLFLYLYEKLLKLPNIKINTPTKNISYYVMNISLLNINGETIVHSLEKDDIFVSTGSACSSKLKKPEKTIYAMTNDLDRSFASVRISMSHLTTQLEIDKLIESLKTIR